MMRLIADAAPQKGEIAMRSGQVTEVPPLLMSPHLLAHEMECPSGNVAVSPVEHVRGCSHLTVTYFTHIWAV